MRARVLIGRSSLKAHLAPIRAAATFAQPYGTLDKQELWWMGIVHADTRARAHKTLLDCGSGGRRAHLTFAYRVTAACVALQKNFGDAIIRAGFKRSAFLGNPHGKMNLLAQATFHSSIICANAPTMLPSGPHQMPFSWMRFFF